MQKIMMSEARGIVGGTCKTVEEVSYGWDSNWQCVQTTTTVKLDKNGNVKQVQGSSTKIVDENICPSS